MTKTVPPELILAALAAGLHHLGENRIQEAIQHRAAVDSAWPDGPGRWHMIGHLQRNKVRHLIQSFDRLDSLDSLRLARAVSKRAVEAGRELPVLLEVNVSGEASKHGFEDREETLIEAASTIAMLPGLKIEGLMTIGPLRATQEQVRASFRRLVELRDACRARMPDQGWETLSMGMSGDFEMAIEEGATEIRLGSALFGSREARAAAAGRSKGE